MLSVTGDSEAMVDFSYLRRVFWFYYSMGMEKGNKQQCTIVVDAYRTRTYSGVFRFRFMQKVSSFTYTAPHER